MPHFFLFVASFASNFLVLLKVPILSAQEFYATYAISNTIFSLFITLIFTWCKNSKYKKISTLFLISISLIICNFIDASNGIAVIYPLAMLCGDYAVSQGKKNKINTQYRLSMIITSLLFIIPELTFEFSIYFRIGVSLSFYSYILYSEKDLASLNINSPVGFLIIAYVFYSGTLMLIPWISAPVIDIKSWYLAGQASLGLLLKRADFLSRGAYKKSSGINFISYAGAFFCIMCASVYSFNFAYFILVTTSSIALIIGVDRFFIGNEKIVN